MISKSVYVFLAGFYTCLLIHAQLSFAFSLIGTQLRDLQANDPVGFQVETNDWVPSSLRNSNKFTLCRGNYILGGYSVLGSTSGQYFERYYDTLPTHTEIKFSIKFWVLDNWGANDKFELKFDGQLLPIWSFSTRTGAVDVCGDGYADLPSVYIKGKIKHSAYTLTLKVISQLSLDTTLQSFGFRDIEIDFLNTQLPITYNNELCTIAPVTLPLSITTCSCTESQYESPSHSGKCYQCNPNCATCTAGTSNSCSSCNSGSFLSGTQCVSCDVSCGTCTGLGTDKCLTCASGYRLNTDNAGNSCIAIKLIDNLSSSFLNAPIEAGTPTFIVLYQSLQYLRYLNITMSSRLDVFAKSQGRPILSLRYGFRMPESWQQSFIKYPLSPMLEKQDLHSSFLVNFWLEFSSLLIILLASAIFYAFEQAFKKFNQKFPEKIFSTLRIITAWNFCFILAATAIGNIIIFSAIEFSTFESTEDSLTNFSLAFCIIVIIAALIFLFGTIIQVKKVIKEKIATQSILPTDNSAQNLNKRQSSQVIFSGFRRSSIFGSFFFFVYTIRLSFPIFLAACMEDAQIPQVVLQILINGSIIACVLITKPLKSKINFVQLVLFESIVFVMNILILVLTVSNAQGDNELEKLANIGDVIIVGNFIINVLIIVFLVIKLFIAVKRIINSSKEKSRQDIAIACLQLLAIPMHQGGMGFEQVFANSLNDEAEDEQPKSQDKTVNSPVAIISRAFASIFREKVTNSRSNKDKKLPGIKVRPQNETPAQDISMSNSSISPMFQGSRSQIHTNRTLETERQETIFAEPSRVNRTLETEKFETLVENEKLSPIKISDVDRLDPGLEPYSFMGKTRLYQIEEAEEMPSTSTVQNVTEILRPSQGKEQADTEAYENVLQNELEKLYSDFLSNSLAEDGNLTRTQNKPKSKKSRGSSSQRSLNRDGMKKVASSSQIASGSRSQLSTHRALESERQGKKVNELAKLSSNQTSKANFDDTARKDTSYRAKNKNELSNVSLYQEEREYLGPSQKEKKVQSHNEIDEKALQLEIDSLFSEVMGTSSIEKAQTVRNHLKSKKSDKRVNESFSRQTSNRTLDDITRQKDILQRPKNKEEPSNIDAEEDLKPSERKMQSHKDIDDKTLQLEIDQLYSEFLATTSVENVNTARSQNKSVSSKQGVSKGNVRNYVSAPHSKHNTHRALESERNDIAGFASNRRTPDKVFEIESLEIGTEHSFATRRAPLSEIEEKKEMADSSTAKPSEIKELSRMEIDDNALQLELERLYADFITNTAENEYTSKSRSKSVNKSSRNSRQRSVNRAKVSKGVTPPKSERGVEEPSIIPKEEYYDYSEDQLFEMLGVSPQKKTNTSEPPRRWKP